MGEIADMMLDGTMCQGCGVWLHGGADGPGYPGYCNDCQRELKQQSGAPKSTPEKIACPVCGRKVKISGLPDHQRDKHGSKQP